MAWVTPITDRTEFDKINKTVKGRYGYDDLNRVGACVQYLADTFNAAGYYVIVTTTTDWTRDDDMRRSDVAQCLANAQALIDAFYTLSTTPDLPDSIRFLTWQGANNIEQVLADLKLLVDNMIAQYRYSGDIYAGEDDLNA